MIERYLDILIDSLTKKLALLEELDDLTGKQTEILKLEDVDFAVFDEYVTRKDNCVQELTKLDEGFDLVYRNIRDELPANKEKYTMQIAMLQKQISKIMDLSMSLQAQESRNQAAINQVFRREREQLGKRRKSTKVALDYYKSSSGTSALPPQFLDKKK
jgi:flagellar biosynthesis/type III secretory pathway chaperone